VCVSEREREREREKRRGEEREKKKQKWGGEVEGRSGDHLHQMSRHRGEDHIAVLSMQHIRKLPNNKFVSYIRDLLPDRIVLREA